jgi:L-cysteine:1D-myo-inositol 2-amino-2-deoxy-alpha-D-glucopyranoside ligase
VISWPPPFLPELPGKGLPLRLTDSATRQLRPLAPGPTARVYVCGITPYDATHLGHAATYVTFDVLGRTLRDCGHRVHYVQNVTDIDDPLLERAQRDRIPWQDLAARELGLFREDMTALAVIPPDDFPGVIESMDVIGAAVVALRDKGLAYAVPAGDAEGEDVYLDLSLQPTFGAVSSWTREQMLEVYAERGGDPGRRGKRDALDPLLWRARRAEEPGWDVLGLSTGRPGWHIECTALAMDHLGMGFDVQGGGTDLLFPHHEMSAVQAVALTGEEAFARFFVHQEMVGCRGEKMSKSRGNLVLVSQLRRDGVDPVAIRLALLAHHYRTPWDWTAQVLREAQERLASWREALSVNAAPSSEGVLRAVREALAEDLDTPAALRAVDRWATECLHRGGPDPSAPGVVARALDALLGVRL